MSESVLVALRGVSFTYEDGPPVFTGLDFEVREGRALALLGRNGNDEPTLMRLLSGGLRPQSGELLLSGRAVRHDRKGLTALRTTVQLVVQDPDDQLFAASVEQDVSFGPLNLGLPDTEVHARVAEALEALDIAALADRPTHLLSYGQRKRTAIAGAVAMQPRLRSWTSRRRVSTRTDRSGCLPPSTVCGRRHGGDGHARRGPRPALGGRRGTPDPLGRPYGTGGDAVRRDPLTAAGLRLPWGVAASLFLRARGPAADDTAPAPRTPEELVALLGQQPPQL
ncbi:ABC transporter ATP-binding protein OS=Streptomyces albaduncus OX=68172 GN=FHS32_001488 PE=3 SV=1 [Streptomyces griseoloalbus]